jgi:AmmeMemoRadiSam system protein A
METLLTSDEQHQLLLIASQAVKAVACGRQPAKVDLTQLTPQLSALGASFVTLTNRGILRGCIGTIEARIPLAEDVQMHAVDAASRDHRFCPICEEELEEIEVEISVLSSLVELDYRQPDLLPQHLRPGIDGVLLQSKLHRSTFLPQVWEKIPDPEQFLTALCLKARLPGDYWQRQKLSIQTYQVESFHSPSLL